jgi:hypothetical protein
VCWDSSGGRWWQDREYGFVWVWHNDGGCREIELGQQAASSGSCRR